MNDVGYNSRLTSMECFKEFFSTNFSIFSYGSPLGNTISTNPNINPRLPLGGQTVYTPSGSERRVTVVKPDGSEIVDLQADSSETILEKTSSGEVESDRIELSEPGYESK